MEKIELLAPAGSMDSLIAAVAKGADAIYLGGSKFSARAYASNFDNEEMEKAVDYCHEYGITVYVTVNTLLKENELQEAIDYVGFLYKIGVDALIIQDTGLVNKIREEYPDFEIHASTQLSIHNGEGALFFRDNGFLRIVLSRELTLEEIRHISKDLNIETEIFVHGALCVSYSGQCLMSSLIGGRSGNRGRCAQSCRLPYTLIRESDGKEIKGYLLSPKDTCMIENVEDLIKAGTSSLKVEGRMKRSEYVAGVTESYREAIDNVYNKIDKSQESNKKKLLRLFNREGFATAYLYKNTGHDMMAYRNPKNTGVFLGEVLKSGEILLSEDIALQDGVTNGNDGFTVNKIFLNGNEVKKAKKGSKVKVLPRKYKASDKLFKTLDSELLNQLKGAYENKFERKILLDGKCNFKVGYPIKLSVSYNGKVYEKQGDIVEPAVNKPILKEKVEDNLKKSGDIAYKINNITFLEFEDGFIRVSAINNLRRELLEEIRAFEVLKFKRNERRKEFSCIKDMDRDIPGLLININTYEQLRAVKENKVEAVALDIFGKNKGALNKESLKELKDFNGRVYLKIPTIIKEEFEIICNLINENLGNVEGIITANAGIINRFKDKTKIVGDYKLNIFNSNSLKFYNKHIAASCISVELNRKEINSMVKKYNEGTQFLIYGKIEAMVSEYCPIGSTFGGKNTLNACSNECTRSTFILKDRVGQNNTIKTDIFCRSHIFNTVAINLISEIEDIKSMGIENFRIDLIDESYEESLNVIDAIKNKKRLVGSYTKGHYRRGVE